MQSRLDFDPDLPRLSVIDDPVAVAELLVPGERVQQVRRLDTKYEVGRRCVAAYEVRRADPLAPLLGAVEVSPDRVEGFLLDRDPALPHVAAALDGARIARRRDFPGDEVTHPRQCTARAVRYKPGVRCVIRYELSGPLDTATYFGKMLSGGVGRRARLVEELRRAVGQVTDAPVVPQVAGWSDLHMLVQPAIAGVREVHTAVGDRASPAGSRRGLLRRVGAALAALHSCELAQAPLRSFADDLTELRGYHPGVHRVDPALGDRFSGVVAGLTAVLPRPRNASTVTSHGAFRTDQMMDNGSELVLIDLDTICRSEPARDIGNLLAYLDWKGIRGADDPAELSAMSVGFLEGYADAMPLPPPGRLAAHRAASLVKIAGRRVRSLTVSEWPLLPALLDAADRLVRVREMEPS